MTDRPTINTLTSDQLDQLYDERDQLRQDLAEEQNTSARRKRLLDRRRPELEHAETALRRARELHRETCPFAAGSVPPTAFTCSMCDALAEPKDQP